MSTSRDGRARRKRSIYTGSTQTGLSRLSLFSAFTGTTTSSGGSNRTVTQKGYNKSKQESVGKQKRRKKQHPSNSIVKSPKVDVFDYLDDEDSKRSSTTESTSPGKDSGSISKEVDPEDEEPEMSMSETSEEPEQYYRSLSDSGISMGSTSSNYPIHDSPITDRLPVVEEESLLPLIQGPVPSLDELPWPWPMYCASPPPVLSMPLLPVSAYGPPPCLHSACPACSSLEGYHLTETRPRETDKESTKPQRFRSFTKLANRLLLGMQDEIAGMEEELILLDNDMELAARLPDCANLLSAKRHRLFQELDAKLEAYHRKLKLIGELEMVPEPTSIREAVVYTQWLQETLRPPEQATRLLGPDPRNLRSGVDSTGSDARDLAFSAVTNLLIPLLCYKVTSNVLNRLIVLVLALVVGNMVRDKYWLPRGTHERVSIMFFVSISAAAAFCR